MYKYLIMFVLATPLIGIWLVEDGALSLSTGLPGEANGATAAFAVYAAVLVLVAYLTRKISFYPPRRGQAAMTAAPIDAARVHLEFNHFAKRMLVVNGIFLLTMLFGFGGIHVWLGTVEKGLFRATLGPLGALPYLMTKFAVPALFAYCTLLYMKTDRRRGVKWMWWLNVFVVFVAGSTWGFKTTGLFMLLPGLLILNWKLPLHKLLVFAAAFIGSLMLFFLLFDSALMEDAEMFTFLFGRLTVFQGDISWYVWGMYQEGVRLPNYWPSLLAAMGDTILGAFVSKNSLPEWMSYHYDWMLTFLSGSSLETIANGQSVTGTPFAEGVIAGGWFGVLLFAVVAGLLTGGIYRGLENAIRAGRPMTAALLSTYFCFHLFSWLNGGGVTQLFHISVVANVVVAYGMLKLLSAPRHERVAASASTSI